MPHHQLPKHSGTFTFTSTFTVGPDAARPTRRALAQNHSFPHAIGATSWFDGFVKKLLTHSFSLIILLVFSTFAVLGCNEGGRRGVSPGSLAPEITGVSISGEPLSLSDIKGKIIVVNFWASWCPPCIAELPGLEQLHQALKDKGIQVVGVAVDDTIDSIAASAAQFRLTFPIIVDTKGNSKRAFELRGLPESYVLDEKHRVMIVMDPADKAPVTRIVGPRSWGEADVVKLFSDLLAAPQ